MTELPVIYSLPGGSDTAMESVLSIVEALAEGIRDTDAKMAKGEPAPLEQAFCADFMPGLQGLVRGAAEVGTELACAREAFILNMQETAQRHSSWDGGPSDFLSDVLKLRGIGNAIVTGLLAIFDAAEAEAIAMDRATAALCADEAYIDEAERVIARRYIECPL